MRENLRGGNAVATHAGVDLRVVLRAKRHTRHTSQVTRHTSHVTRHTSHVTQEVGVRGKGGGMLLDALCLVFWGCGEELRP